jgi:NitT/TauT family transport system permease protein
VSADSARASGAALRLGLARGPGHALVRGAAGIVIFIAVAQVVGESGLIKQSVLPLMSTVLARTVGLAGNGRFIADLGATLEAWAIGLAVTTAIAVPLGLLLGSLPVVRVASRSVVEFLRPIPSVALILLVELLVGSGLRMTLTLICYGGMWAILYNTMAGLDDVDPVAVDTLRAFGFGRLAILRRVSLPSAMPFIATGIRIASSVALILSIAAGYITGRINGPGVGAFISDANSGAGNTPLVLAAVVWTGFLGLALNLILVWLERRLLPWHRASLGDTQVPGARLATEGAQ